MSDVGSSGEGGKRRSIQAVVAQIERETDDTVTLHLFTDEKNPAYRAGQFLTIDPREFPALIPQVEWMEKAKGLREPPRAYSMSSAPHDRYVAVTVKVDGFVAGRDAYPPLLSPYLTHGLHVGQRFEVKGYMGHYVFDPDLETQGGEVLHLCAGSGIVPNFSLIKDALDRGLKLHHTLLFGNRKFGDIIFLNKLDALQEAHPDQLKVVHALSGEPDVEKFGRHDVVKGRVDAALIAKHVRDAHAAKVYLCGPAITRWEKKRAQAEGKEAPPRFIETMLVALDSVGVARDNVVKEAFG